jgi:hypothetical protein
VKDVLELTKLAGLFSVGALVLSVFHEIGFFTAEHGGRIVKNTGRCRYPLVLFLGGPNGAIFGSENGPW